MIQMEQRLGESRANTIRNAIVNDRFAVGSTEWCEEHYIGGDEFMAFLQYAVDYAKMLDFKAENADAGSVDVELTFTAHNGKVGDVDEKWTCFAPQSYTNSILRVAEHGKVIATLVPEQMAIHLGETKYVDHETGEVLA
ncbi:MAG: hypothetical protein IKF14_13830 [Atopobiaceae bacterium]|nr:hypothetical protein [Atopobiaceae bacterium]